jgi:hypothetical protein
MTPLGPPTAGGGAGSVTPTPSTPAQGGGGEPTPVPGTTLPYLEPTPADAALPARVWLLTPEEYARAVESVLGTSIDVSDLDPIPDNGVYPNMSASGVVRVNLAQQYTDKATAATEAVSEAALRAMVPCGSFEASCRDGFIAAVTNQAFRRPATAEELERYAGLFELGLGTSDATLPFRAVLRGVLTSPYFLYRTEIGAVADEPSPTFRLTSHEVATFLSFSVLGRPPTPTLRAAADRGELTDPSTLQPRIAELFASPEAGDRFATFLVQWLRLHHFQDEVQKFEDVFPGFNAVKGAMFEETRTFLGQRGGLDGTLTGILTAPLPEAGGALAAFYASGSSSGATTPRIGLLSLGALLAKTAKQYLTSPTLRGLFVRDQLLCQHITLPADFTPPPIEVTEASTPPKTTRELYALHAKDPACASCHALLDGVGFAFESFDGAGRYRTVETYQSPSLTAPSAGPQPVDASGELVGTDVDVKLASYVDLSQALASSAWVKECVTRQAFRYYFGELEPDRGLPAVIAGTQALRDTGVFGDLLKALIGTASTVERRR